MVPTVFAGIDKGVCMLSFFKNIITWMIRKPVTNLFHYLYYSNADSWPKNTYRGFVIHQNPIDLQTYHELIFNLRPKAIIQTGVFQGGSMVFFSSMLDFVDPTGTSKVIGVDIVLSESALRVNNNRVHLIEGDSTSSATLAKVKKIIDELECGVDGPVMVILDSDHSQSHVQKELVAYSEFVSIGSYLVVEDTNLNGWPVNWRFGPGPHEAVVNFIKTDKRFLQDNHLWERNFFSFHQYGWLKRIK
jgi:cephalosporin hydroxylase